MNDYPINLANRQYNSYQANFEPLRVMKHKAWNHYVGFPVLGYKIDRTRGWRVHSTEKAGGDMIKIVDTF